MSGHYQNHMNKHQNWQPSRPTVKRDSLSNNALSIFLRSVMSNDHAMPKCGPILFRCGVALPDTHFFRIVIKLQSKLAEPRYEILG